MPTKPQGIYDRIRKIIENARGNIARAINTEMVLPIGLLVKKLYRKNKKANPGRNMVEKFLRIYPDVYRMILGRGLTIAICGICENFI